MPDSQIETPPEPPTSDPGLAPPVPGGDAQIRVVDFSHPTKFDSRLQRRIERAFDLFCAAASTRLTSDLRVTTELSAGPSRQGAWSGLQTILDSESIAATVDVAPIGTHMLLLCESSFALVGIECILGGAPTQVPEPRRFSDIDWALTSRLVDAIVRQLSLAWREVAGVTLATSALDTHNDASPIAPATEPALACTFEARIDEHTASLALLIPWQAIEPIADRIAGLDLEVPHAPEESIPAIVSSVPVTLRAEVADARLAIAEIVALAPGSVITLDGRADDGVTVYAENVRLCRAQPGTSGGRRAILIRGGDGK